LPAAAQADLWHAGERPGRHRPQRVCFVIAVSDAHPATLRFIHNPGVRKLTGGRK